MPNWVTNRISVEGPEDQVKAFFDAVKGDDEDTCFDFRKILPMPETLHLVSGSVTDQAVYAAIREDNPEIPVERAAKMSGLIWDTARLEQWREELHSRPDAYESKGIVYDGEALPHTYAEYVEWGRAYRKNKAQYGATTWYDWAYARWGTKWNACSSQICEGKLYFDTAWSAPAGIVAALPVFLDSLGLRDLYVEWEWAEEQGFFGGRYYIEDTGDEETGFTLSEEYFEDSDAAYDLCEDLLGYSSRSMAEEDDEDEYE